MLNSKEPECSLPLRSSSSRELLNTRARRRMCLKLLIRSQQFEICFRGHAGDGLLAEIRACSLLVDVGRLGEQLGRDDLFLLHKAGIGGVETRAPGLLLSLRRGVASMRAERGGCRLIMHVRRLREALFSNDGLLALQFGVGTRKASFSFLCLAGLALLWRLALSFEHPDAASDHHPSGALMDAQDHCDLLKGVLVLIVFIQAKVQLERAPLLLWQDVKELLDLAPQLFGLFG